jgi:cytokinin dehydrogenase
LIPVPDVAGLSSNSAAPLFIITMPIPPHSSQKSILRLDPEQRGWSTISSTGSNAPPSDLDGVLTTDAAALDAAGVDYGHIVHHRPIAVLRPGSLDDVVKMMTYAYRQGIRVSCRGNAFNTFGQSQAAAGIVIDMSSLGGIHEITSDHAIVDAGITWRKLLLATLEHGLTPAVLTDFLGTTVGGTLSVGGFGGTTYRHGGQIDHALELQVVTGTGELITCSAHENASLFNAVLGGLGLCAIIVRATLRLHPAPTQARTHRLRYPDLTSMLNDLRFLIRDERFSHLRGHCEAIRGAFTYFIEATSFWSKPEELPEQPYQGLGHHGGSESVHDRSFFGYADLVVEAVAALDAAGLGDYPHPWLDLIVADNRIEAIARQVIESINPARVLPGSPILFYPMLRSKLTRQLPTMPDDELCYGFDILRTVPPHPGLVINAMQENRRLYELNRALGGRLYPISAVQQSRSDWKKHFAPHWDALLSERIKHDPGNLFGHAVGL